MSRLRMRGPIIGIIIIIIIIIRPGATNKILYNKNIEHRDR